ncbi:hypothetical protein AVEN_220697-1 [Araneus ventricosus]|uniref:RNase H type-1 domain-containing protein n=1 Tax=Araneus ventricosus TaxID=182803 RepID=A0A4Y2UPH0_ARAVE|nr:hypothetical protein AVEN_220697-1 [Araneus ventricosus]
MKAHSGYIENEEADRLAKEAAETENFPETPLELPKPFIKTFLRQKMLATWQMAWDDGDTGRLIHNIIPKIQPCRNLILFLWLNRHIIPLCYGLPPHNLLPYATTQPTTSACMVPQRSQQFNVKNGDT